MHSCDWTNLDMCPAFIEFEILVTNVNLRKGLQTSPLTWYRLDYHIIIMLALIITFELMILCAYHATCNGLNLVATHSINGQLFGLLWSWRVSGHQDRWNRHDSLRMQWIWSKAASHIGANQQRFHVNDYSPSLCLQCYDTVCFIVM